MKEMVKHWTSSQVKALLRSHFGGGGKHTVLFEVRDSTGHSASRSVDAVTMSLWPSLGLELTGMEIKISRSDWLRELKDPAKASATFEYFDRWYLVAPRHVANIDEIPRPWGWMAPENDKIVIVKRAPLSSDVKAVDRKFLAALLRCQSKQDDGLIDAAVARAAEVERKRLSEFHAARLESEVSRRLSAAEGDAKSWNDLKERLGEKLGYLSVNELAHAVGIVYRLGVKGSYGALANLQGSIAHASKQVSTALAAFDAEKLQPQSEEDAAIHVGR